MRITIGGLLFTMIAGAGALFGPLRSMSSDSSSLDAGGFKSSFNSFVGLFKSGQVETSIPAKALQAAASETPVKSAETSPPASVSKDETGAPALVAAAPVVPAAAPATSAPSVAAPETPAAETAAPKKRLRRRHHKKRAVEAPAPAPEETKVLSNPPKRRSVRKSASEEDLTGTYVSLTLKSGRDVRGVLQEKTATHYKIQLPGMGPFDYPVADVKSIKAVQ